ncbi:putative glycolipid-binding domain-containing protein [Motilibacter deserti]|uniref:putative glycolipid-binding domain-containing protein n=1 Tax=Motilibacter deserti TaxID=2714956 RepID=UPI001409B619|nr:putative glycolipid-binding domain-containing protein [Motilibacter deserti]
MHDSEVVYLEPGRLRGHTSAVEDGRPCTVRYDIRLDEQWRTREAHVVADMLAGPHETSLRSDGEGSDRRPDTQRFDHTSEGGFTALLEHAAPAWSSRVPASPFASRARRCGPGN